MCLDDRTLLLSGGLAPSELDVRFHQQMAYAVARHTVELFQNALGRPVTWPWARPGGEDECDKLRIYPHSQESHNAWFQDGAVHLGYCTSPPDSPRVSVPPTPRGLQVLFELNLQRHAGGPAVPDLDLDTGQDGRGQCKARATVPVRRRSCLQDRGGQA